MVNKLFLGFLLFPLALVAGGDLVPGDYGIPAANGKRFSKEEVAILRSIGSYATEYGLIRDILIAQAVHRGFKYAGATAACGLVARILMPFNCLRGCKGLALFGAAAAFIGRAAYCRYLYTNQTYQESVRERYRVVGQASQDMETLAPARLLGTLSLPDSECVKIKKSTENRNVWPLGALLNEDPLRLAASRDLDHLNSYLLLRQKMNISVPEEGFEVRTTLGTEKKGIYEAPQEFLSVLAEVEGRSASLSLKDRFYRFIKRGITGF